MRLLMAVVVCTSITVLAGCSREVRSTVTGKVDYDGQTLNSGYITFQVNYLVTKGAEIASDGSYVVDGLPFGSAAVSIYVDEPPPPTPEGITPTAITGTYEENPVLIPRKYDSLETSGITVEVAMPEQTFDIHLAKPEKSRRK
ncbi:MAG: hypothetical protein HN985_09565 [Planctomycetaceae bacterium]|jgi:hypothetical protein|nr:hypothetical protein [Planctomycetaceae bacterium]MBT6054337.1 hypothetical protein [Planctomycetaceae bacterium]MBT6919959.1 hypothetical protein [Planctomycetaceae bacterium]